MDDDDYCQISSLRAVALDSQSCVELASTLSMLRCGPRTWTMKRTFSAENRDGPVERTEMRL